MERDKLGEERMIRTDIMVEELSSKLHDIYMKEARRQGDVRHSDNYSDLKESTKEYDRVLARYIIQRENAILDEIKRPLIEFPRTGMPDGFAYEAYKAVHKALSIIQRRRTEK